MCSSRLAVQEYCTVVVSATNGMCLYHIIRHVCNRTLFLATVVINSVANRIIVLLIGMTPHSVMLMHLILSHADIVNLIF